MKMPEVENIIKDDKLGVTFIIKAPAKLTRDQMLVSVREYLAQSKERPPEGATITILSRLGA